MTTTKIASDNNRLRTKLLDKQAVEDKECKGEKIVELEFLLGEYKRRNKELVQGCENNGNNRTPPYREIN